MRVLLSWLREFVDAPEAPDDLAHALTMAGMAVDGVSEVEGEVVFELDITSNRPDAMNHFGVARELAAIYGRPLRRPETKVVEGAEEAAKAASIEILDADLCPRYSARVVRGVEIRPSPDWLRKRLELCGIRGINNIADLTNYVLLELGHPTHAFDLERLRGSKIVVRRARAGETLCTLDGVDRELAEEHLVIADAERAVALAGVMGGLDTEISDSTRNVLFESAWFAPGSIRKTARGFGMHTEASHRFERGADIDATVWAADRIANLIDRLSPGSVLKGRLDAYPRPYAPPVIELRRDRIARMLGQDLPASEVEAILRSLGFGVEESQAGWKLLNPSWRLDIWREIDVIEELARIFGYDKFEPRLPESGAGIELVPHAEEYARLRATSRALGYDETVSLSFISAEEAERFGAWPAVALRNPLTEVQTAMRNSAVPAMLRAVEWNVNRNEPNARLAEFGRVYRGGGGKYEEPHMMTLGATGMARAARLGDPGKALDFYDIKSDVVALLAPFDLHGLTFSAYNLPPYYAPGHAAQVTAGGVLLGYLGEADSGWLRARKIKQPVFLAEIFLDPLYEAGLRRPQYRALPRVPAVDRDFSLFVPEGISFDEVAAAIGPLEFLVSVEPLEIFRGEQVPNGYYSLLLRASWQKAEASLTDEEVNGYAAAVTASLSNKLGIKQRA